MAKKSQLMESDNFFVNHFVLSGFFYRESEKYVLCRQALQV